MFTVSIIEKAKDTILKVLLFVNIFNLKGAIVCGNLI